MSGDALRIGWKVRRLAARTAGVRYRAVYPALGLPEAGFSSRLFESDDARVLDGIDRLVLVKCLTEADLALAGAANARGVPVVLDLCDNIFVEGYRDGAGVPAAIYPRLAPLLDAVVAATEPLAEAIRSRSPAGLSVHVVADAVETASLQRAATRLLAGARRRGGRPLAGLAGGLGATILRERDRLAAFAGQGPRAGAARRQVILWFGIHGAPHGDFGMTDLLLMRPALERIARERAVELVVVSNSYWKYRAVADQIDIPARYVAWSPAAQERWLDRAAVVVIPNRRDEFSICKSANRAVLALERGVPVVATPTPALEPLTGSGCIAAGDDYAGLSRYLSDPAAAFRDVGAARALLARDYDVRALGAQWGRLLAALSPGRPA